MTARETRFEELKRYVALTPDDAAQLRAFRERAAVHFERIAHEFYDRIRRHEEAHAVFVNEAQISRLQRSLVLWMHRLLGGVYDEAYFEETAKIGRVHVRVGLPQRYMFTAMALIRSSLTRLAEAEADDGARAAGALSRLLDLELAIMLESYHDDLVARLRHVDTLEKRALGDSLARTEHRFVNAVEFARVLVVGLDTAGVVHLFNREAERVTGFARDEALGRHLVDVLFTDDPGQVDGLREILADFAGRATSDPVTRTLETTVHTRSRHARVIEWHLTHAPGRADDVSVFAIGRDITDARALHERSKQQAKLAALGTLAAGLAHEIRNPLNGAQLHVTYLKRALQRSGADRELQSAADVVLDEMNRLGGLVREFLDFARPQPLRLKPVSVQALLARVAELQPSSALHLDVPAAPLEISADPAKLEQVLLNLTRNALEATEGTPGGSVTLRARRQPYTVTIDVEDNGPGIPPGAPIFDAFFSTKPQGTGLGLSISYRIVSDHGGALAFESAGDRTVFHIVLPIDGPDPAQSP
ncbi:MAG: PAS domain-containing protein [Myxococcales bacterium]|nr:PAS domain-containing protein [Myxococcales bacterium]